MLFWNLTPTHNLFHSQPYCWPFTYSTAATTAPLSISSPSPFHWHSLQPPHQLAGSALSPSQFDEPLKTREVTLMGNSPSSHNFCLFVCLFDVEIPSRGADYWAQVRVPPHCSLMLCSQKPPLVLVQAPFFFPSHPFPSSAPPHPPGGIILQLATQSSRLHRLVLLFACPNYRFNKEAPGENVFSANSATGIT